ncbi:MAG: hypothetical protein M3R64_10180, partial [Pseudomonadota bacterium]|nr:hypothetical protein [Pseudomonadota bacterium]
MPKLTAAPTEPLLRSTRTPAPAEIITPDIIATEPTPGKIPAPVAAPIANATATNSATPDPATPDPAAPDPAAAERGSAWLWWLTMGGVLAALALSALMIRRRRVPLRLPAPAIPGLDTEPPPPAQPHPEKADSTARETPAESLPPPVAPIAPADRPALQLDLRPVRAGLNLLSALVEGELTITNAGRVPLEAIAIATTLVSAHRDSDADLAAFAAQPIGRPVVPVFTLTPGEARTIRIVAPLARAAIQPMHAGGRAIFVPIVGIACRFVSA